VNSNQSDTPPVDRLETVELETGPSPSAAVIWLHGLGADGHDFEPIVPELQLAGAGAVRFVFPHAPVRPVTINGGMPMRAWYDIMGIDRESPQDEAGIRASARKVDALIRREVERGIPAHRIVLAGFSQGGAVALHLGLRFDERLAGILALSTYLPLHESLRDEHSAANAETPLFMAHGILDPVVPLYLGESSANRLVQGGWPVTWRTYTMPHAVCPEEIRDISGFLADRLASA
jgi:phospholipase/carboxylesterase